MDQSNSSQNPTQDPQNFSNTNPPIQPPIADTASSTLPPLQQNITGQQQSTAPAQPLQQDPSAPIPQSTYPAPSAQSFTPPPVEPLGPTQSIDSSSQPQMGQALPEDKPKGSGKKIIFLVAGMVSLLIIASILYFFVFRKKSSEPLTVTNTAPSPTPASDSTMQEIGDTPEEQEVIDIEEIDVDSEFETIDKDLEQL